MNTHKNKQSDNPDKLERLLRNWGVSQAREELTPAPGPLPKRNQTLVSRWLPLVAAASVLIVAGAMFYSIAKTNSSARAVRIELASTQKTLAKMQRQTARATKTASKAGSDDYLIAHLDDPNQIDSAIQAPAAHKTATKTAAADAAAECDLTEDVEVALLKMPKSISRSPISNYAKSEGATDAATMGSRCETKDITDAKRSAVKGAGLASGGQKATKGKISTLALDTENKYLRRMLTCMSDIAKGEYAEAERKLRKLQASMAVSLSADQKAEMIFWIDFCAKKQ